MDIGNILLNQDTKLDLTEHQSNQLKITNQIITILSAQIPIKCAGFSKRKGKISLLETLSPEMSNIQNLSIYHKFRQANVQNLLK